MDEDFYRPISSQKLNRQWKKMKYGTVAIRVILLLMSLTLLISGIWFVKDRWDDEAANYEDGKLALGAIFTLTGFLWTSYNLTTFTKPDLYTQSPAISDW